LFLNSKVVNLLPVQQTGEIHEMMCHSLRLKYLENLAILYFLRLS